MDDVGDGVSRILRIRFRVDVNNGDVDLWEFPRQIKRPPRHREELNVRQTLVYERSHFYTISDLYTNTLLLEISG